MRHKFILLFFAILCLLNKISAKNSCTKKLHFLAATQKDFVQCTTLHSVPVSLCVGCEMNYTSMVLAYNDLKSQANCSEKYFNKDRINIVSTMQSLLIGVWNKAYCDDCFNSNNSWVFDTKSTALSTCFNVHKGKECLWCMDLYKDLNDFYTKLDDNSAKVCYDIQDQMNRTRLQWSKEFQCCKRDFDMTLFLCASSLVALLPFIFYGSTYAYGRRRERNHDVLDADAEIRTSPHAATIDVNAQNNRQGTAVQPVASASTQKLKPFAIDSEDDDDDDVDSEEEQVVMKKQL